MERSAIVTISARMRSPRVIIASIRSVRGEHSGRAARARRAANAFHRRLRRLHGARPPWSRRYPFPSVHGTSGSRSSCSSSRRAMASAWSGSRTRRRAPRGAGPSRCGRAISSGCGRRSSVRPFSGRCSVSEARDPGRRVRRDREPEERSGALRERQRVRRRRVDERSEQKPAVGRTREADRPRAPDAASAP